MHQAIGFAKPVYVLAEGVKAEGEQSIDHKGTQYIDRILITSQALEKRIQELGKEISRDYTDSNRLVILTVLAGAQRFSSELVKSLSRSLDGRIELEYIKIASYQGTSSIGEPIIEYASIGDFSQADVLVVDDIIETERTKNAALKYVVDKSPRSVKFCALLDKRQEGIRQETAFSRADYVGFSIPDEFVIGIGLDYDGRFRELPYLAVLKKQ